MLLKDKTIAITGGGRGIGRAIAVACARAGARVAVAARSENELRETADLVRQAGGEAFTQRCDVTRDADVTTFFGAVEKKFGPLDGLVCAAGIYGAIGRFEDTPINEWTSALDVNLMGTARCIHAVVKGMKRRGGGHIVTFSGGGQDPMPRFSAYTTSKGAVWRLTESLGAEFAADRIYVNAIAPGVVNTGFLEDLLKAGPDKVGKEFYELSMKQKSGEATTRPPDNAAKLAVWLLSAQSAGLYGKLISANYDKYEEIKDLAACSRSQVFTMKRVVTDDGRTKY